MCAGSAARCTLSVATFNINPQSILKILSRAKVTQVDAGSPRRGQKGPLQIPVFKNKKTGLSLEARALFFPKHVILRGPKMTPKLTPNGVEHGPRNHRTDHHLDDLFGPQGGPKMTPKRTPNGVQNGPKNAPSRSQFGGSPGAPFFLPKTGVQSFWIKDLYSKCRGRRPSSH